MMAPTTEASQRPLEVSSSVPAVATTAAEHDGDVTAQEKLIEEKEERLQRLLNENKAKLQSMEADLLLLKRDLKLTSAPKKAALELLRKRIEEQSERVRSARSARAAAAAALEDADAALASEEASKAQLVRDMNTLIFQSTQQQMQALEALQTRMDALAAKACDEPATAAVVVAQTSTPSAHRSAEVRAARAELEAAAAVSASAEAAEARLRHVALAAKPAAAAPSGPGGAAPQPVRPAGGRVVVSQQPRATTGANGGFSGFAV